MERASTLKYIITVNYSETYLNVLMYKTILSLSCLLLNTHNGIFSLSLLSIAKCFKWS